VNKRILMVAFHYPPIQGSSGVHRTLSFSKVLAEQGWQPTVLTVNRGALPSYSAENEGMVPAGVNVIRAFALDTKRHLTFMGKYPGGLAIPDSWVSWVVAATVRGLAHIALHRPSVLYSTYPIASAHLIGYVLHRLSGVPWIADLRDPMAQDDYPHDPRTWRAFKAIEERIMAHASRVLFAAPSALSYYRARYPAALETRGVVLENGYDEALFVDAERGCTRSARACIRLVHAGVLYPQERDPSAFLQAVAALRDEGLLREGEVEFILRGSAHEELYRPMIAAARLDGLVKLEPPVGYREALVEMLDADGLMLFQSAGCNFQIPAKVYEYFRARRPIVAFTDPAGDTGQVLAAAGVPWIAQLDSPGEIKAVLTSVLDAIRQHRNQLFGDEEFARACSREGRGREFQAIVEQVAAGA